MQCSKFLRGNSFQEEPHKLITMKSNNNWMEDAKNLGKNTMDQLTDEDDVIIIDDDDNDTTVIKEVESTSTSVVDYQIWIKPQFSTKPTNTDHERMKNDLVLQNLKDPLSDDDGHNVDLKTFLNSTHLHEPNSNCHCDKKKEIKDDIVVLKPKYFEESVDPVVSLTRDALTILDTDEKVFQCPHCEYRNDVPGKVSLHIKKRHIKSRRYACSQCDYKASRRTTLEVHIRARHTKEKPYTCMYCSYKAAQAGSLLQHIRCRHMK